MSETTEISELKTLKEDPPEDQIGFLRQVLGEDSPESQETFPLDSLPLLPEQKKPSKKGFIDLIVIAIVLLILFLPLLDGILGKFLGDNKYLVAISKTVIAVVFYYIYTRNFSHQDGDKRIE